MILDNVDEHDNDGNDDDDDGDDGGDEVCGTWWLSGGFGALRPEGRRFGSHSRHHVGTSGKSFIRSWL